MTNEKTIAKMTKKQKFETLLKIPAVAENEVLVEFINHELELLAKKNSADRKPTSTQVINESLKDVIYATLTATEGMMTVSDMIKTIPELSELSNQKVASLVRQLKDENKIERIMDKRKAYFKAVED